jgi:carbonic anhydrase/acetyltransferase-like protein (isoleucine patch superfamily)
VTVGSCAQIGRNCHLSGGVGIGGVLEPLQANPTIIEDNCFIGARSEVVEGVVVGEGSVLSMGVFIGASTKIVDRATGEVFIGRVPPYSVVVSGALPGKPLPSGEPGPSLYCAVIVKQVDARHARKPRSTSSAGLARGADDRAARNRRRVYAISVASVCTHYVARPRRGRTKAEVDQWLTGYSQDGLERNWREDQLRPSSPRRWLIRRGSDQG